MFKDLFENEQSVLFNKRWKEKSTMPDASQAGIPEKRRWVGLSKAPARQA
jgi:hypothetical protein